MIRRRRISVPFRDGRKERFIPNCKVYVADGHNIKKNTNMKKLYFVCMALVALMLASCGGKDYRDMLPADSFMVVSINPESLSRKAQVGDFTQSVYYKMAEQALTDAPEEERGRILSLLAHPSESGLDVGSDVFMFVTMENASQTGNPTVGGLFKVSDRKKLDGFLGWIAEKGGLVSVEEDGIVFLTGGSERDPMIAYDENALLVYDTSAGADETKVAAKKLFSQKKTESLMGNSQLAQAIERPSDMKFVMDYGSIMEVAGEQIGTAGLSGFEFLNNMSMAMPVDFEKGKIVAEARILFSDKKAEKQYMEMVAAQRKMDGDFLKMLPAENVATLAGSMDGARTYEMLQKIPMYSMVFAMAPQVKPIMEAIDGDIALSFHGMTDNGRMPELSLIAELKDPAIMETIKGMIPVPMQEMAPGQYALSPDANTTIYFGLNDNTFYATTDSDALVFLTGAQTSAYEAEVGKLFRGSYGTMFVDFPAVRSLIESLIAQNRLDQSAAASLMALSLFDTLEITGRTERQGELVLNMTDKDKNAAEVLYKTIEGFAQMFAATMF